MELENSGEQEQAPAWDRGDSPPPAKTWERGDTQAQDQAARNVAFVLNQGATKDPERAARVYRLTQRYTFPEDFVDKNLDKLEEAEKGGAFQNPDLINTNPKLAKIIADTGPSGAAVASKYIGNLKALDILYNRPPDLYPYSDDKIKQDSRHIAHLRAVNDFPAQGDPMAAQRMAAFGGTGIVPGVIRETYPSQEAMEEAYYQQELEKRRHIESVIAGSGPLGPLDTILAKNPDNPILKTFIGALPIAHFGPQIVDRYTLNDAKKAVEAGTANDIQKDIFLQNNRLERAIKFRGRGYESNVTSGAMSFPAMAGDFAIGGALGRGASAALGFVPEVARAASPLAKLGVGLGEAGVGTVTTGLPAQVESFMEHKAAGDSNVGAGLRAFRDVYADYAMGTLLGPWYMKASPEVQQLARKSIIAAMPKEALKMVGMTVGSDLLKATGDFDKLKDTLIVRAMQGDPDAWSELAGQATVGAVSGAGHAIIHNTALPGQIENLKKWSEGLVRRGELLQEGIAKDAPEVSTAIASGLSKGGPNEYVYLPVNSLKGYYGNDAAQKAAELIGDPAKYEHHKASGADLVVPSAVYDHVIGADPQAAKFFANEVRPDPESMNLREAGMLERAYAAGIALPKDQDAARKAIVAQIVEHAKGDKIRESVLKARLDNSSEDLLADPAMLGLTDEQVTKVSKALAESQAAAEETLQKQEVARRDRLKTDLYQRELERQTKKATEDVDSQKEYKILADLQNGTINGEQHPELGSPAKISREVLKEEYPALKLSDLPRGITNTPGSDGVGVHPDILAERYGYNSGHDLLYALMGLDRGKAIDALVKSRMEAKLPSGLTPSELSAEAIKALHNEHTEKLRRMALDYLVENKLSTVKDGVKVALRKVPSPEDITRRAWDDISTQKLSTLDPRMYLSAERQADNEGMAAALRQDWQGVFDAKMKGLEAHERYRAATTAVEATKKALERWPELATSDFLNKPGTYEWGQQVKNLLRKIGIYAADPRELNGMKPFQEWADQKYADGLTKFERIPIDPRFAEDSFSAHYSDLTYGEFLSLKETVDRLAYLAKDTNNIQIESRKVAIQSILADIGKTVAENFKRLPPQTLTDSSKTVLEKALSWAKKFDASLDRPEAFFARLDGGRIDGPISEALWRGQVEARQKYYELKARFTEALNKANDQIPAEVAKLMDRKIQIPGIKVPLTYREIMAIAANGGNESNYSKMRRGEAIRGIGLTPDAMERAVGMLPEVLKDHVQKILDITNQFWPEIEDMHKWATGTVPDKIEAKQMFMSMGDRPGGYYPAMYDKDYSKVGEKQISGKIGELVTPSWVSSTTDAGYRKGRIEDFAAPMDFDFQRLAGHVDAMAKDLAFRKWLLDANKIVNSPEMMDTLRDYLGPEYRNFAREWVKRVIAADSNSSEAGANIWRKAIGAVRHNVTVASLAFKPSVLLHHALGIGPAISEVGPEWFMKGYGEFLSDPKGAFDRMISESPEMANYSEKYDTNVRESLDRLSGKTSLLADVQRFGMKVIPIGNMMRVIPTYYAAKAKAVAELSARGMEGAELESYAIKSAERAVRLTSGSGNPGDIPAIMKSDVMKALLMFYTPGSVNYSLIKTAVQNYFQSGRGLPDLSTALVHGWWLIPFSAAMHTIVSGRLPNKDKRETYLGMIAKDAATYGLSAVPMGSELGRGLVDLVDHKEPQVSSPLLKQLESTWKTAVKTEKWYQNEGEFEDVGREMFKTAGYWMGAPTEQMEITGGYLSDLMRHRVSQPHDIFEFAHDMLWRRPKGR